MMFKKIITVLTLISFIVYLQGCYTYRQVPGEGIEQYYDGYMIKKVVTIDGEIIEFAISNRITTGDGIFKRSSEIEGWKKPVLKDDRIEGFLKDGSFKTIPLSQVKMIYLYKFSALKVVGLVVGISVILAGVGIYIGGIVAGSGI